MKEEKLTGKIAKKKHFKYPRGLKSERQTVFLPNTKEFLEPFVFGTLTFIFNALDLNHLFTVK